MIGGPNPSGIPGFNAATGIAATTTGAANAVPLPSWFNVVTSSFTTNSAVSLPPGYASAAVTVVNNSTSNSIKVYGSGTDTIASSAVSTQVSTGVSIAAGAYNIFMCILGEFGNTNNPQPAQWKAMF